MKKTFILIIILCIFLIKCPCFLCAEETGEMFVSISQLVDSQVMEEQSTPDETAGDTSVNISQLTDLLFVEEQTVPDETTGDNPVKVSQLVDPQGTEEQTAPDETIDDMDEFADDTESDEEYASISDPLEPINRVVFHFNDKLYTWVIEPVASHYKSIVPEPARVSLKNFFSNLEFPIRFVNCILQGKVEGAAYELSRFLTNSIIGVAGFFDVAEKHFDLKAYDEDFGQTLGSYGLGNGIYINWPFLGPSSLRDTIGDAGDYFLDPIYYTDLKTKYDLAQRGLEKTNNISFTVGDYEDLKRSAIDPYIAFRDAYFQYRQSEIKK